MISSALRPFPLRFLFAVLLFAGRTSHAEVQAFKITLIGPAANSSAAFGTPLTFTATVSANANPVDHVDFYDLIHNVLIGTSATAPYTATWTPPASGTYYFRATGTDIASGKANSAVLGPIIVSGQGGSGGGNPPPPPPPPSTYPVNVINGTGGGQFAPGAAVTITAGAPPAGQWFKSWSGNVALQNSFTPSVTFTMPANSVTMTANFYTPPVVPQPVAGHPRLWINQSDLAALRARAKPQNPTYQSLLTVLNTCLANYNTKYYPGGSPAANNPDFGDTQGYTGLITEQNAIVFALFSLIDNDPNARIAHAQRARNLIMRAMNEAVKGHAAGQPFRDPMFALFNRANAASECWPLAIDWIYDAVDANGNPILTAADKQTIRDVFLIWANDCLNAYVCGGDHPAPIGVTNSPTLLPGNNAYRVAANNYYAGHARLVTLMSLCIDPADDPAVNPSAPLGVLGNSLRSYIPNATGAWLYQQFAMFGDPATVKSALGLPANAIAGLASGGLSPEGGLYGHSYSYILGELLALQTAGFADPSLSGPQASLVTAPVWDRYLAGFAHTIVPAAQVFPGSTWLGPVYQLANYGDILRTWITPDFAQVFALKNLIDQKTGSPANDAATRWFAINAVEGGAGFLAQRIQQPWSYGVQASVLYFLLLDPAAPPATDPRPGYATTFQDPGNGRLLARSDWGANAAVFSFRSSWESINHQNGDAGQFELYRKGEWLTKELSNYDNNGNGQSTIWHNTLALHNWCANGQPKLNFFENAYWPNGSQWNNGMSAGDPVTVTSTGVGYAFAETDLTKLYNRPNVWTPAGAANDIQHASRSILWLNPDVIVVYDRATSLHSGFKRFNLNYIVPPNVSATPNGPLIIETTPKGQKLFVQSLLPLGATVTLVPLDSSVTTVAQLEQTIGRVVVEAAGNPTDTRFLHVLQGADAGAAPMAATGVASSGGSAYEGAVFGSTAVLCAKNYGAAFAGTSYVTADTVKQHFVTGLTPGGGYTANAVSANGQLTITLSAGGSLVADSAGLLAFTLP